MKDLLKQSWRAWVLMLLFVGPTLVYVVLGALWLAEHRGPLGFKGELLLYGVLLWVACGVAFALFANRWTGNEHRLLPPIDWDRPETFTPRDLEGWKMVQEEAVQADTLPIEVLLRFDTFEKSGLTLARRLASHYRPDAVDPVNHVAVVELLTAFQLAAEDLGRLCREVPGGDLITPAHYQKALQAANYVQRASDLYNFLLPVFQPLTGLARLGVQKLLVQPAWRGMQRNLLRWFFRAYLNRLGHHLIELYSGRLAVGAETYRRLTRTQHEAPSLDIAARPLVVAIAGARGSGKSTLLAQLERCREDGLDELRRELEAAGFDPMLLDRFEALQLVEVPGYDPAEALAADDRRVVAATGADLLLLAIDAGRTDLEPESRFLTGWTEAQGADGPAERPPALGVLTHADRSELGSGWFPPYDWVGGKRPREQAVRRLLEAARARLAPPMADVVAVGLPTGSPAGVRETLVPELVLLLQRAERVALLRLLSEESSRSTARRILGQIGRKGRQLWRQVRTPRRPSRARG